MMTPMPMASHDPDNGRSHRTRIPGALRILCPAVAAGLGLVALAGWVAGVPSLATFAVGKVPMAPSTALLFLWFGTAILLHARMPRRPARRWTGLAFAWSGAGVSLLLLILSLLGIRLAAEHLGIPIAGTAAGVSIGHISPLAALCFVLTGLSLAALLSGRRWTAAAFSLASLVGLTGAACFLAYLLGSPVLYGSGLIPPSLPTSLAFLMLGAAIMVAAGLPTWIRDDLPARAELPTAWAFVTVFILLAAGIVTAGFVYLRTCERHYRAEVNNQIAAIAKLKADELASWRTERLGDAGVFYKNAGFAALVSRYFDADDASAGRQLETWLGKIELHADCDRVSLLDAHGMERMSVPAKSEPMDAPLVQGTARVLASGQVEFVDFYRCENDGRIYLAILVPIVAEPDHRAVGVLALCIDPTKYLYPTIASWPIPSRTGETLIVRREGNAALFLNELRFKKDAALKLRVPLDHNSDLPAVRAALGQEGIVEGVDYRGEPVIAAVRPVPGSPWFLIARMDTSEAYAPLRERWWMMLGLIAVMLVGGGGSLRLLWRQRSLHLLRCEQQNLRAIFASSPVGMLLLNEDTMIVEANGEASHIALRDPTQIIGRRGGGGLGCVHSFEHEKGCGYSESCPLCPLRKGIVQVLTSGTSVHGVEIQPTLLINGREHRPWLSVSAEPVLLNGRKHVVVAIDDITLRKEMEAELRTAARTDKLTGLPNRALFCDRLRQAVLRAKRLKDYRFAVLFLDFDRFKTINDSLGHEVGDQLLREIAARLQSAVRYGDSLNNDVRGHTAARFGGDEFLVLLDGIAAPGDAIVVAERLLDLFSRPYRLGEHEVYSTASIGIVTSDNIGDSDEDVLRDADTAMYAAKLAGRGRYAVFDASMRHRARNSLSLENDLRKALDGQQLFLMYQPIVSLRTGEIEGFEALVRWKHPQRGIVSPGEFIPIAEDTGLIIPIGQWVLEEACRQLAHWRRSMGDAAPRSISVNLSRNQLLLPDLHTTIQSILDQTGVPPASLHLEVTEGAVMRDVEAAGRVLSAIKQIGAKLDIDDFGTSYSSLSCLHQLPFDVLKIDRSFVASIDRGRDLAALVHAVNQLARNLGISVVAEGIETMDQLLILQSLECDFGQGYYFSRPMSAADVASFRVRAGILPGLDTSPLIPLAASA